MVQAGSLPCIPVRTWVEFWARFQLLWAFEEWIAKGDLSVSLSLSPWPSNKNLHESKEGSSRAPLGSKGASAQGTALTLRHSLCHTAGVVAFGPKADPTRETHCFVYCGLYFCSFAASFLSSQ